MRRNRFWIVAVCALAPAACAGEAGPPPGAEPAPTAGMARLYVYREVNPTGSPIWTMVSLDRRPLGQAEPGTVFYRDVPPGTYEVEVRSDKLYPNQFKTVRLAAGSRTFVKIGELPAWGNSPWGWQGTTFVVTIVEPALGAQEIAPLRPSPG
ncbi:MAG TPA: hypothetical protein VEI03_16150 [Stellaceae bacterium]|nr:hypothetical protein [Stellaceae bacterium]